MKILTWNINGIRGNKGLGLKQLLDSLDADVICLQETKVSREQLDEASAIVDGYNSYFSFSRARAGYSGVATFVRDGATPWKAEDGLTGLLHEEDEELCIGHLGDHSSFTNEELEALDREGRCVMTQHVIRDSSGVEKDLVIINVYCPRAEPDNDIRKSYKMRFYQLLQSRAETILKSGRHVIVLGDINTSHRKIDHCDPTNDEEFYANPGRKWLDGFLYDPASDGATEDANEPTEHHHQFVDTFRLLHPEQLNAFTNWSSATGARETNYGCRLDYIFADKSLAQHFFVQCFIMPEVMGSDHCPVKAVLDCSVVTARKCPSLCTRFMLQFSGKQQKLSMFLIKTSKLRCDLTKSQSTESSQSSGNCDFESVDQEESSFDDIKLSGERNALDMSNDGTSSSQATTDVEMDIKCTTDCLVAEDLNSKTSASNGFPFSHKRVLNNSRKSVDTTAKKSKVETQLARKQSNLLNFLVKNPTGMRNKESKSKDIKSLIESTSLQHDRLNSDSKSQTVCLTRDDDCRNEKDGEKVEVCTEAQTPESSACISKTDSMSGSEASNSTFAWKSLLKGPPQTPLCKGHKEPCALRTVKKSGPNRGRQFWTCNRPEGHKTNPEARCDYFVWVSNKK